MRHSRHQSSLLAALCGLAVASAAASAPRPSDLAHTYSIVARDPVTGELGVGVQSHWFSVGPLVAWAEAGVGAVATQSLVDPAYGPLGLDLMRAGKGAPASLRSLLAGDDGEKVRQVAMVDAAGRVAVHTGSGCIPEASHASGDGYSTQANLMRRTGVPEAMARAYESADGDLAARILAALRAAEAAGGDIRGRQSAALLIVSGKASGRPWADRLFDLRVEDHATPVEELARLVRLQRAYRHMNEGDERMEAADVDGALRAYAAAEAIVPDSLEMVFWHAVSLVNAGRTEPALPLFRRVFAADPSWAELVPRLARVGFLPDDEATLKKLLDSAKAR